MNRMLDAVLYHIEPERRHVEWNLVFQFIKLRRKTPAFRRGDISRTPYCIRRVYMV